MMKPVGKLLKQSDGGLDTIGNTVTALAQKKIMKHVTTSKKDVRTSMQYLPPICAKHLAIHRLIISDG